MHAWCLYQLGVLEHDAFRLHSHSCGSWCAVRPVREGRVHPGYGEHRGILVTVVTGTVTVSNFSIPCTLHTLTRSVQVYHGVRAVQVQLGHTGEHTGHGQGGDTKKVAAVAGRRQRG